MPEDPSFQDDEPRLKTRLSLIDRLKSSDPEGWRDFSHSYGRMIRNLAIKAGCSLDESQEVEQETLISVARDLPRFDADPKHGSFRGWLLTIARRRIIDQFRKRPPANRFVQPRQGTTTNSTQLHTIADDWNSLSACWEEEWQKTMTERCLSYLKSRVNPAHYQIFHLAVIKEKSVDQVAQAMGVTPAQVHLIKFRLTALLKKERKRLENEETTPPSSPDSISHPE